nr:XRE family transcriptional regulator [Methylobacterium oryzae]
MLYADFLTELERAGLTIREFASLVQMRPNSVSNYASRGEIPTHLGIIAALISELNKHGVGHQSVFGRLHLSGKRPRGRAGPGRFGGDRQGRLGV